MTAKPRTEAMIGARRADSAAKRARVLTALEDMAAQGEPITFTSVARKAGVSTWLVHAPGVRQAIDEARTRQPAAATPDGRPTHTQPSDLATDLALARAEIARLRSERDNQQRQLQLALGARLDDIAKADLVARVDELTRHNTQLVTNITQQRSEIAALKTRIVELEDDLAAARTSLRRMIRAENLPTATATPKGEPR